MLRATVWCWACVLGWATSGAAQVVRTPSAALDPVLAAEKAPVIVIGTVERLTPVPYTTEYGDQLIATEVTIRVERTIRGRASTTPTVVVTFLGGKLGNREMRAEHWEIPTVGTRLRVFLSQKGTRWMPVNGNAGARKEP